MSGTLTCAGADTMHDLADEWARDFRRFHPDATVRVRRDGKFAAEGLEAVMSGEADCALFVREPFPAELAKFRSKFGYVPTLVNVAGGSHATKGGTHAIAIFVNAANPLGGLNLEQLDAIFSRTRRSGAKEITTWGQLGLGGEWSQRPIRTYGMLRRRDTANPPGIVNFLEQRMLGGGEFRDDIREQPGTAAEPALDAIVRRVADDPAGIGYSGFAYARPGAKAVAIARTPTAPFYAGRPEEIASRAYPLSREIYLAVNRAPGKPMTPLLREFLLFTLSREGQR
ncbi:MAG: substrate-binding domain-containing protein, partial [Candidatus Dormibacteraeota bacterium]|nr:substrate-binding domain-containing protein [Candidatus Dormibacteraeota bacterium]